MTHEDFVKFYQKVAGLNPDGIPGEATQTRVDGRSWPLRNLSDGRPVFVTNPFVPGKHDGVDLFWWRLDTDKPARTGYSTAFDNGHVWYPVGTMAVAAAAGRCVRSESISTGYLVVIEHANGDTTGYFHGQAGTAQVFSGDSVSRGQSLFVCGWDRSAPLSDTNVIHLHFSVQRGGAYMDPAVWLRYASRLPMD
ncbi:MAG TPA: peptidoglycan DD-metalloendopeptidase family protein [Anaerolineae bacterium]|nr:peptidoglycan DD-metalloendopeptidase family protein [Anaerolineae bacterium]